MPKPTLKNPWLRGCGKWRRGPGGITVERTCEDVTAEVHHVGRRRFRWAIYAPGHAGKFSSGTAETQQTAKTEAEAALVRYAKG